MERIDTVVVGAGQAGLAVSYLLGQADRPHIVLERGRIGESWRSQRWDSFALNTPNWSNLLPGAQLDGRDPDAFGLRDEVVEIFEKYAASFAAPIEGQTTVTSVERQQDGEFEVKTDKKTLRARNVVVCSGSMSTPRVPPMARDIAPSILTINGGTYRNAQTLPKGAVVVVGSAQTGCQITEDLLAAGREVFLCTSKVGRLPRQYRGRDLMQWMVEVGLLDVTPSDLEDPSEQYAAQPQVSGTDGGHTISLQSLARDGATLLGKVERVEGAKLHLRTNVHENVEFADALSAKIKHGIDEYIAAKGIDAPPAEPDPYEPPMPDLHGSDELEQLDVIEAGVSTIIWCTGFRGDFSWIHHDILDERGLPRHDDGISEISGLYFVGFPWLSKRKSGILYGVGEDAKRIVDHIAAR